MIYRIGAQYMATDRLDVVWDYTMIKVRSGKIITIRKLPVWEKSVFRQGVLSNLTGICRSILPFCIYRESAGMALTRTNIVPAVSFPGNTNRMPFLLLWVWPIVFENRIDLPKSYPNQLIRIAFFMRPLYTYLHLNVHLV